jgi:putative phosphoribosyl transferase
VVTFRDRRDAGRRLAVALDRYRGDPNVVVLGLPRGGIAVAFEVAMGIGAPLDAIVVRKLGLPAQPELAMGAIGEGGVRVLNEAVVRRSGVTPATLSGVEAAERSELERRVDRYRAVRPRLDLTGRTALIVDDGLATGATARAACLVARELGAGGVVLAVPVGPPSTLTDLARVADDVVCLHAPEYFGAVARSYRHFGEVSTDEVVAFLADAQESADGAP